MPDEQPHPKGVRFIATSRKELIALGPDVARSFGYKICEAQKGLKPTGSKPLPQFGPRTLELIKDLDGNAYRCNIYITKKFIYILVPYMKKSHDKKAIPKGIVELTNERLAVAKALEERK